MSITIDCDFPGGNIIVDRIEGDNIYLQQDLRDTEGHWFYWAFRIKGAAGRTLTFNFTNGRVIGVLGPGVSPDLENWSWTGKESVECGMRNAEDGIESAFEYTFSEDEHTVYFSFGFVYTQDHFDRFISRFKDNPFLQKGVLCTSNGGREVEKLVLGRPESEPEHRILFTARNHCCEMIASYGIEGVIQTILEEPEGEYFRQHTEVMVIPFADKDGVEQGDQGKNRKPRDHNRDYDENSLYAETKAIQETVPAWSKGKFHAMFDLHCPYISGNYNQDIYAVGCREQDIWERVTEFCRILEKVHTGEAPYHEKSNLPFGQAWNTGEARAKGMNSTGWARSLPGIDIATTFEIPYTDISGVTVTKEHVREFGKSLVKALHEYLTGSEVSFE